MLAHIRETSPENDTPDQSASTMDSADSNHQVEETQSQMQSNIETSLSPTRPSDRPGHHDQSSQTENVGNTNSITSIGSDSTPIPGPPAADNPYRGLIEELGDGRFRVTTRGVSLRSTAQYAPSNKEKRMKRQRRK